MDSSILQLLNSKEFTETDAIINLLNFSSYIEIIPRMCGALNAMQKNVSCIKYFAWGKATTFLAVIDCFFDPFVSLS